MAYALGITVGELNEMPYDEYNGWVQYFKRRPIGWREDQRIGVLLSAYGGDKIKPERIFPSLKVLKEENNSTSFLGELLSRGSEENPWGNKNDSKDQG